MTMPASSKLSGTIYFIDWHLFSVNQDLVFARELERSVSSFFNMNHDLGISLNLWVFSHSIPKDVVSELDLTVDKVPRQDSLFMKKVKN